MDKIFVNTIAQNLQIIHDEIAALSPKTPIKIMGVTKYQPLESIRQAVEAGVDLLGVNRIQDGKPLREALSQSEVPWHFIGHIQSNKAKEVAAYDAVHSLEREKIAQLLNQQTVQTERDLPIYVEVNLANESRKSGVMPENVESFLTILSNYPRLRVEGLMCLPPPLQPVSLRSKYFKQLRRLGESLGLKEFSMGTSADYPIAIQEGATLVRLGTCLFGARQR